VQSNCIKKVHFFAWLLSPDFIICGFSTAPNSPPQFLESPSLAQKQIIFLSNKNNGEIMVLCNLVPLINKFSAQLSQFSIFQVFDSTVMSANDANWAIHFF
jgi:hypothetical protein